MHHRLLIAGEIVRKVIAGFEEGLPKSGNVAMAEDPQAAGEEAVAVPVALNLLRGEEANERLGHGQSHGATRCEVMGSLGSRLWSFHEARTQACVGSSQNAMERFFPGPASTLRKYRS